MKDLHHTIAGHTVRVEPAYDQHRIADQLDLLDVGAFRDMIGKEGVVLRHRIENVVRTLKTAPSRKVDDVDHADADVLHMFRNAHRSVRW